MLNAILTNGNLLRCILETINKVNSDVTLQVSPRGLEIKERVSQNVALIWLFMEA